MAEAKITSLKLNRAGIRAILKSPGFAKLTNDTARAVAEQAGEGAVVDEYTTDRRAAGVSVPAERQAVDGALTRAAAAVGLEVRVR